MIVNEISLVIQKIRKRNSEVKISKKGREGKKG